MWLTYYHEVCNKQQQSKLYEVPNTEANKARVKRLHERMSERTQLFKIAEGYTR